MQISWIPSSWASFKFGDFGDIVFVVDAVAEEIPKVSKSPFQCVCSALLLSLFKCRSFAFAIFDVAITYVLWTMSVQTHINVEGDAPHDMCRLLM